MSHAAHIDIIHKIPEYKRSTKKRDKRKIKEIMRQYEYDDDVTENINDDFCEGFDAARYIVIEMLKNKYCEFEKRREEGMKEFCIEWLKGSDYAGVTVPSGTALKSKLMRLAEEKPDEVKIKAENRDGSAFFHIPISYVKISPPRKVSDEQREAAGERFRKMWEEKKEPEKYER